MDATFKKLNYKGHEEVHVINAPTSFEVNVDSIKDTAIVKRKIDKEDSISFVIAFATKQVEVDSFINNAGPKLDGDALLWLAYPKGSSKKYTCDFNRDTGWSEFGKYNLEGVRQVAIDADWSALRFRKIEYIKNFTRRRSMALSKDGKKRSKK